MISNAQLGLIANSFNNIHKDNYRFDAVRELISSKKEDNTFLPTQLEEIRVEYTKRKEQLEKFEKEISSLESLSNNNIYKNLIIAIHNEIASLDMMVSDVNNFINTREDKYIESVVYGFEFEKEQNFSLIKAFNSCERDFGTYIYSKALVGEINVQELKNLIQNFEQDSVLYKNISEVIAVVEKRNNDVLKESQIVQPELVSVEQKESETQHQAPDKDHQVNDSSKQKEPTLQEKLNRINYTLGNNLHAEVQTITSEDTLENVTKQIKQLESKDKLSFKEIIQLHTLKEQELGIQKYMEAIETQKLSLSDRSRENKLAKTSIKIEEARNNLALSRENFQSYDSKIMRFFSMRYQEQLQLNIENLKQKNGLLTSIQKESAVAKFDKNSRKINRSAKFAGLVSGTKQITTDKIEQLKQLKTEVLNEIGKFKQDIGRFSSVREELPRLQSLPGVIPDNIIYLEEHTQSHRMSA